MANSLSNSRIDKRDAVLLYRVFVSLVTGTKKIQNVVSVGEIKYLQLARLILMI